MIIITKFSSWQKKNNYGNVCVQVVFDQAVHTLRESFNPDSLFSNETGVNLGIKSSYKHVSEKARFQKVPKEVKRWDSTTWFELDNFKPRLKNCIFKCISWVNCSFMGGDDRGFLKEWITTYLMAFISPLNALNFSCLHIYDQRKDERACNIKTCVFMIYSCCWK